MKDRARLMRFETNFNKGMVANEKKLQPIGGWIHARLNTATGAEERDEAMFSLPETYILLLYPTDENRNFVIPEQSDRFEIKFNNSMVLQHTVSNYKIIGTIEEVRQSSKLSYYRIGVIRDTEF